MARYSVTRRRQAGVSKVVLISGLAIAAIVVYFIFGGEDIKKAATLKSMEVVGNIATRSMPDDVAGGFHKIPIEVKELAPGIYQATGISNTHMITTSEGNVLYDSGIAIQAAKHVRLLKEKSDAPVTHIILSHSHADHIGGTKFWIEEGTEVLTHREFTEEQRYLKSLENYQWQRNRVLFPWMPPWPRSPLHSMPPIIARPAVMSRIKACSILSLCDNMRAWRWSTRSSPSCKP